MKIMHVITRSVLGGAPFVVVTLANEQSKEHDIIVAAGSDDGKIWPLLSKEVTKVPLDNLKREVSFLDIKAWKDLRGLYRKYRPDIIHLHSSKAGVLGRLAFPKEKTIYTVHGFDSIRLIYRKYLFLERLLQRRCRAVVGVSEHDQKTMKQEKITKNVSYIYNGIIRPDCDKVTNVINRKGYDKTVLCIARTEKPKRIDIFLQTAALLPKYAFVWIGNKEEITEHPENVFFNGNIPNAGNYVGLADLLILPSDYEGLPIVILEAMSHGLPIVASNVGGVPEMVINDYNGYAVDNNAESFARRIDYILNDEEVSKRFSDHSLELFNEKFTADQMVAEYYNIYSQNR